jgi:carbon-monoxide dehydrogenase medium subunit
MKSSPFEYHLPATAAEAAQMLADLGEEAKILAGGQSLIPMLALRLAFFDHLVDISRLADLKGIERRVDHLRIGAGTTEAAVGASAEVASACPLLTRATPFIGHFQIRNRGTLGGSIAHADAAAEYPAVALALDASLEVLSVRGVREIPATEYFTGLWSTAMEPDEILVGASFPIWSGRSGHSIRELARRHGDFAIAGATVSIELGTDDRVRRCGIGLIGLGTIPRRAGAAEQAALGRTPEEIASDEVGRLAVADLEDVPSDLHGTSAYRRKVGATMVARAWTDAMSEARRG